MYNYLIVVEKTETGYSTFSPDIPGCIATGKTKREVEREIKDTLSLHLEGMKKEGLEIPKPKSYSIYSKPYKTVKN